MSISDERPLIAEGVLRNGSTARLWALPYDDPVAQDLVEQVQQEYVARYGGRDEAVVDPAEFLPPEGLFLAAEVDGAAVGSGAWRALGAGVAEIKRVYVVRGLRRRGLARLIVDALERSAAQAGCRSVVLNSGAEQPEALRLYDRLGYGPVTPYGVYACAPDAVFLGKDLPEVAPCSSDRDPVDASSPDGMEERPWAS